MDTSPLAQAIEHVGLAVLARELKVTHQAVRKWERTGLPRTEWTGETNYAECIERLTDGRVLKSVLMAAHHPLAARGRTASSGRRGAKRKGAPADLFTTADGRAA